MGWRERERFKTHTGWIRFELLSVFSPILCCFDTIGQPRGPIKISQACFGKRRSFNGVYVFKPESRNEAND